MISSLYLNLRISKNIIFIFFIWKLIKIINDENNTLSWYDIISSRGPDGINHTDITKIGQAVGAILAFWLPAVYAYSPKVDGMGLAAVMGVSLTYLGAVGYGAAALRVKQSVVE